MKKKVENIKYEKYMEDVTAAEIARDFMRSEFFPEDWESDDFNFDDYAYFFEDYELTDEECKEVWSRICELADEEVKRCKKLEKNYLKDRASIYRVIEDWVYDDYDTDTFKLLSVEEILDLIIENGNK